MSYERRIKDNADSGWSGDAMCVSMGVAMAIGKEADVIVANMKGGK